MLASLHTWNSTSCSQFMHVRSRNDETAMSHRLQIFLNNFFKKTIPSRLFYNIKIFHFFDNRSPTHDHQLLLIRLQIHPLTIPTNQFPERPLIVVLCHLFFQLQNLGSIKPAQSSIIMFSSQFFLSVTASPMGIGKLNAPNTLTIWLCSWSCIVLVKDVLVGARNWLWVWCCVGAALQRNGLVAYHLSVLISGRVCHKLLFQPGKGRCRESNPVSAEWEVSH